MAAFETVDAYIASFPSEDRRALEAVRAAIRAAAPVLQETISYGIPTFTLHGRYVVYFAGWKRHISVYPIPSGDDALDEEMAPYRKGRGTLRFPFDRGIPLDLIARIAARLLEQRLASER